MKLNMKVQIISWVVAGLMATSCTYDQILEEEIVVTVPVSFSADLIPIFNASCNMAGCHNGSVAPDLRVSNAYNALISGSYVNTANPTSSELYLWMTGSGGRLQMPPGGTNATNNAIILAWIEQGALNN